MSISFEWMLLLFATANILLLGMTRLKKLVHIVAIQGLILGIFSLVMHGHAPGWQQIFLSLVVVSVKGFFFPAFLLWTIDKVGAGIETTPLISPIKSIAFGVFAIGFSLWISSRLPVSGLESIVSIAFFTIFTGLFLLVCRRKAVSQVLGYLVLENGVYLLGYALVGEVLMIVEIGVLLDLFVAVFIMGIAIYRINLEFDHIDVDRLNVLKG